MPKDKKEKTPRAPKPTRTEKTAARAAKKQVAVIDMHGEKTVKRKTSVIKRINAITAIIAIIWIAIVAIVPLQVKKNYSEPIKKSIVVSMFFDLQRNLQEQYTKMLRAIADSINLEKPIGYAIDAVKVAQKPVEKVKEGTAKATESTARASEQTAKASEQTGKVKDTTGKLSQLTSGLSGKLGIDTSGADKAIAKVNEGVAAADRGIAAADKGIDSANQAIAKVDDVADQVNAQLEKVKTELARVAQFEIDKALDEQVKNVLDKYTGLGTTLLTDYGVKHIAPWKPSTWKISNKIYSDLEKSSIEIISSLMGTVNKYFGYVAWGLVAVAWLLGLIILFQFIGKMKSFTKPFIVCPRCGHTFADKRTGFMFLKILQPWKWFA